MLLTDLDLKLLHLPLKLRELEHTADLSAAMHPFPVASSVQCDACSHWHGRDPCFDA